ncbi:MAG: hypothetical protein DME57_03445 [Verrucomicrobia bacterium]|nr:MAG: hypothetical protein DME57_03445 [Verrucomicrobiota bacterium]
MSTLLQIVPRVPGGIDGVGDYALTISRKLRDDFGCDTIFATFRTNSPTTTRGFQVLPLEGLLENAKAKFDRVLLHYVNYGYQKRGVPFRLLSILRALRRKHPGRMATVFHEIYASGPPWTSAFWLQPFQIDLAKSVARLTDVCLVSSDNFRRELIRLMPHAEIHLHPIPSGIGEPALPPEEIANRDPHRWAIFGGTGLTQRSLRSFRLMMSRIPDSIAPRELFLLGGEENPATRSSLVDLGIETTYRPCIAAGDASEILRTCSFAWLDYFHRPNVETLVILKSSAFASLCAHAVITVLPHSGSPVVINGERMPGPFYIEQDRAEIPDATARARIAGEIYACYRRQIASENLIERLVEIFALK